jgi:SAM-dependent methyltransferase
MASTEHQRRVDAFDAPAPEHFAWQTAAPFVAERERELVEAAFSPLGRRVLDLGCGEGATLHHLGAPEGAVGLDWREEKLVFARSALPRCELVAGSVEALPFEDGRFDHVLVRDLVHHMPEAYRMIDEIHRVLAPGGRVDVLEPCRYNPLVLLHAVARPTHRGELRSTEHFLSQLLERRLRVTARSHHQPLPIHRLVFHPDMGRPALGGLPAFRFAVDGLERLAGSVLPRFAWAYVHVRAEKRA